MDQEIYCVITIEQMQSCPRPPWVVSVRTRETRRALAAHGQTGGGRSGSPGVKRSPRAHFGKRLKGVALNSFPKMAVAQGCSMRKRRARRAKIRRDLSQMRQRRNSQTLVRHHLPR